MYFVLGCWHHPLACDYGPGSPRRHQVATSLCHTPKNSASTPGTAQSQTGGTRCSACMLCLAREASTTSWQAVRMFGLTRTSQWAPRSVLHHATAPVAVWNTQNGTIDKLAQGLEPKDSDARSRLLRWVQACAVKVRGSVVAGSIECVMHVARNA
jgi:hypothetical protein